MHIQSSSRGQWQQQECVAHIQSSSQGKWQQQERVSQQWQGSGQQQEILRCGDMSSRLRHEQHGRAACDPAVASTVGRVAASCPAPKSSPVRSIGSPASALSVLHAPRKGARQASSVCTATVVAGQRGWRRQWEGRCT